MKPKIFFLSLIVFSFLGCKNEGLNSVQEGNFEVELLFEKEGCKMYRFKDGVRYIYYSDCSGKTEYKYHTGGKSGSYKIQETITTN